MDALDPNNSSKNTLKLENVSFLFQSHCENHRTHHTPQQIDGETGYIDRNREKVSSQMARIRGFSRQCTDYIRSTNWVDISFGAKKEISQVQW